MCSKNELFALIRKGQPSISDFVNVYNCAVLAQECTKRNINIYDPQVQASYSEKLTAPIKTGLPFYSQNSPIFYVLVKPLVHMSIQTAWIFWCLLFGILIAITISCFAFCINQGVFTKCFILFATFASYPTWVSFRLGQTSLILLPGMVAIWWLLARKHFFWAGIATIVCLIKLQYLPIMAITGLVLGGFRYFSGLLCVSIFSLLVSIFSLGITNVLTFPQALLSNEGGQAICGVSAHVMQNIRGQLVLLTGADSRFVHITALVALMISTIFCAWVWWRYRYSDDANQFKFNVSVTTLLLLITGLHTHVQDYILCAIPCLCLYFMPPYQEKQYRLLKLLILSFPLLSWLFFFLQPIAVRLHITLYLVWAILVLVLSLLMQNRKATTGSKPD